MKKMFEIVVGSDRSHEDCVSARVPSLSAEKLYLESDLLAVERVSDPTLEAVWQARLAIIGEKSRLGFFTKGSVRSLRSRPQAGQVTGIDDSPIRAYNPSDRVLALTPSDSDEYCRGVRMHKQQQRPGPDGGMTRPGDVCFD